MRDVNKVILRGVVSDAPESRTFGDGTRKLVSFSVKTVTMESEDDGSLRERPAWHRVDVWGDRLAEVAERLAPDSPVYLEGRLRTRSWERDGERHYLTSVVADVLRETDSADPQVNCCVFVGNIGVEPELKEFERFTVLNFKVAASEGWTPRDSSQEHTEWVRVSAFDSRAKRLHSTLSKGQRVFVEGMLTSRKWQGQDGRERRFVEVRPRSVWSSGGRPASPAPAPGRERSGMRERLESQSSWDDRSSGVDTDSDDDSVPF